MRRRLLAALTALALVLAAAAPTGTAAATVSALTSMKILTVGDSITLDGGGPAYRAKLEQLLVDGGIQPTWVVAAVSGSRCTYWSPLIKGLLNTHQPDLVILSCGTNDDTTTQNARDSMGWHFRTIVETIRTHRPDPNPVKIITGQIGISDPYHPSVGGFNGLPAAQERANSVLRQNIAYYAGPWAPAFQVIDLSRVPGNPTTVPDGTHPGVKGHALYARLMHNAGAAGGWWPASTEPPPCDLYGHPMGTAVPAFTPC